MDPRDKKAFDHPGTLTTKKASDFNALNETHTNNAQLATRIETCKTCPELNQLRMCRQCGCFMPAKVRIKSASCPIGKWHPIIPLKVIIPVNTDT